MITKRSGAARRMTVGVICAALVAASCSGSDGGSAPSDPIDSATATPSATSRSSSDTTSPTEPPPSSPEAADEPAGSASPTTLPRATTIAYVTDPDTGEATEVEIPERGPTTYEAVVDAGVHAGLWDEIEGLRRVLGYVLGVIDAEQVPGVDEIMSVELTAVLQRAHAMSLDDAIPADDLAGLKSFYDVMVPGSAVLDAVASGSPIRNGITGMRSAAPMTSDCAPVDPANFSSWAVIEGCYLMRQAEVAGARLRVFYPAWYDDVPELTESVDLAEQALRTSTETYEPFGPVGDVDVIFSIVDTVTTDEAGGGSNGSRANANHNSLWGIATDSGPCPVTVFPRINAVTGLVLQGIAHEVWHCVQHYSGYPLGVLPGHAWYREGGADYFSNLVYPHVNYEHRSLELFDQTSVSTSLLDMSYEAWIWWQWLEQIAGSPRNIADYMLEIVNDGDGGASATTGYGEYMKQFIIDYVAGQIREESGDLLPASRHWSGTSQVVTKNDVGKTFDFPAEAMVARRWRLDYDQELRVLQSDVTEGNGFWAMVPMAARSDVSAWQQFFPEVRSQCRNRVGYVVVATADDAPVNRRIKIDRVEEAPCDPCVLGTWELEITTFESMLIGAMEREGGALPAGATFEFSGHYYTSMEDAGVMKEQRDGLVVTVGMAGQTFDVTIYSFAHGSYTADGETLTFTDVIEDYADVTTTFPGVAGSLFPQGSSISGGGSGTYECRDDDMIVTMDGFEPIRLIRVDKILEPRPLDTTD